MHEYALVTVLLDLSRGASIWVLWLLVGLSVLATATILERALLYRRELPRIRIRTRRVLGLQPDSQAAADDGSVTELEDLFAWLAANPNETEEERDAVIRLQLGTLRRRLLDRTSILGSLGANTPFIGLLGTVLGIIEAFAVLAETDQGPDAVMGGISEALVATGLGLLVAIPCVMAYNAFVRRVDQSVDAVDEGARLLAARAARDAAATDG